MPCRCGCNAHHEPDLVDFTIVRLEALVLLAVSRVHELSIELRSAMPWQPSVKDLARLGRSLEDVDLLCRI